MLGQGRAEAITDTDIANMADSIYAHPADLEAISKVESGGFGWFDDGRIKILFEKHIFYKYLDVNTRALALLNGIARKSFVPPSKGGYKDQANAASRYKLLEQAIAMNPEGAYSSISVGRYQIMGFNHKIVGYPTAQSMFDAFCDSEVNQLKAFSKFLKTKNLTQAVRERDFERIETVYNGGGLNGAYAQKMRSWSNKLRAGKWKDYRVKVPPLS